ncbi:MAG TPA: hypothetical protein VGF06_18275 [Terriglobales bacterium]|jgi:uncharacterized membrane protein
MLNSLISSITKQRMIWSWALIVSLLLVFVAHAPVLPVIAGGLLAIVVTTLRSSGNQPKPSSRGGR